MNNKIIWVLDDNRAGNYSQSLGLAKELENQLKPNISCEIQIKKINYNFLSTLPNFLKINGLMGIDKNSKDALLNQTNKPNIIISAGRKTAPIAAFLKKQYQATSNPLAIQIMNPNFCFSKFDVVVLPNHDQPRDDKNIIRITGSLTRINEEILDAEYEKFAEILGKIPSPKIALLVGGSSKKGRFTPGIAVHLGKLVSNLTNKMNANLLVLNSRRTGNQITEILDQNLNCPKNFFKWQQPNWKNPYFAVLKAADFIIVTGDSISMCSEICSLAKPTWIFNPEILCSKKHLKFHQNLFDGGFSRKFDDHTEILENYFPKKLDETKRIAQIICHNLLR